jgi:antitoxin component YwqK of YwqJK toxin-antitoxin module
MEMQNVHITDIEMLNLENGRIYAYERHNEKVLNGKIRIITEYSNLYIHAEFINGYAEGKWEYYSNNKLSETMDYKNGYLNGVAITYQPDGTIKERIPYRNSKINGKYIRYYQHEKIEYEKEMTDGIENGIERFYDKTGRIIAETFYKNGKIDGKSFFYYERGEETFLSVAHYKDGELNGEYSEIFGDGSIKTKGKYIEGKKEGIWESYKSDKTRRPTEEYKDGTLIRKITYHSNGNIEMERNYNIDGRLDGIEKKYDQDGNLKSELSYKNGKQVGKQIRFINSNGNEFIEICNYNESGKKHGEYSELFEPNMSIKSKGQYVNGQKHGKWTYGHKHLLYQEETYDNGRLVNSKVLN